MALGKSSLDVKDGNAASKVVIAAENSAGQFAAASLPVDENGTPLNGWITPDMLYAAYLTNGGSNDLTVDGSGAAVTFDATVPVGKVLHLHRILFYLDSATAFAADKFGSLTALTNGVSFKTAGVEIANAKDNVDFVTATYDFQGYANLAKATNSGAGRWTFTSAAGAALRIAAGEKIEVVVQDDLTALTTFRIQAQGCIMDAP